MPIEPSSCETSCGKPTREKLSILIVGATLLGITLLSATALWGSWGDGKNIDERIEAIRYVFGSVLPLLGTWIGTVLAYYFTRENLQAAGHETRLLVKAAIGDKLRKVMVRDAMIPRNQIIAYPHSWRTETDIKVLQLRELIKGLVTRVPILDESGRAKYVVHSSILDAFVAQKALEASAKTPPSPADLSACTLADLLADAEVKKKIADGLAFVAVSGTLADAKERMESKGSHCQDIFVTSGGTQNEAVLGWITNVDLAHHANT